MIFEQPGAPLSPVLSLSCFSNLLRLSLHTHGVRWLCVCQRSLPQFHLEPSHHLIQQKNILLYDSRNPTSAGGFGAVQRLYSLARISTEALLLISPIGEGIPQAPNAGPVVLSGVVPFE